MHDSIGPHQLQRRQHLRSKSPDQNSRESGKLIRLDQFKEVDAQQLGHDAKVTSEIEAIRHAYHVVFIGRIPLDQLLQDFDLDKGLRVEPMLVPDNLDGHRATCLVIPTLNHLAK